jgi:3-methyladenine DNA glycosylase Tag
MRNFADIRKIAIARHGEDAVSRLAHSAKPKSAQELAATPDDRFLSMATRCVFQAGFNWKVIDSKWDGFEAAFAGFDLRRWSIASDDDIASLLADQRIVRNGAKIATVPQNARFLLAKSRAAGGVGRWIGAWPAQDHSGLLAELAEHGSRLGGATGQYFLRFCGRDGYILSRDVTAALAREGVIAGTSKKATAAVQTAFNRWREQSGASLTEISRTLALSIDG